MSALVGFLFISQSIAITAFSIGILVFGIVLGIIVHKIRKRRTRRGMNDWSRAAKKLGLSVERGAETAIYPMSGTCSGRVVKLAIALRGSGDGGVNYTYCRTSLNPELRLMLRVESSDGLITDAFASVGSPADIVVGHSPFDRLFKVNALDPERAQRLLLSTNPRIADLLVNAKKDYNKLIVTDEMIYADIRGSHFEIDGLRKMLDSVVSLANQIEAVNRSLPLSPWEQNLSGSWRNFAAAHGWKFDPPSLSMAGDADGFSMDVSLVRNTARNWGTRFVISFGKNLMMGLSIEPQGALGKAVTYLGVQDIQTGIAEFDDAFLVKAKNVQMAALRLDQAVCARLLRLKNAAHELKVTDDAITLTAENVVGDARILQNYLDELITAARLLSRN